MGLFGNSNEDEEAQRAEEERKRKEAERRAEEQREQAEAQRRALEEMTREAGQPRERDGGGGSGETEGLGRLDDRGTDVEPWTTPDQYARDQEEDSFFSATRDPKTASTASRKPGEMTMRDPGGSGETGRLGQLAGAPDYSSVPPASATLEDPWAQPPMRTGADVRRYVDSMSMGTPPSGRMTAQQALEEQSQIQNLDGAPPRPGVTMSIGDIEVEPGPPVLDEAPATSLDLPEMSSGYAPGYRMRLLDRDMGTPGVPMQIAALQQMTGDATAPPAPAGQTAAGGPPPPPSGPTDAASPAGAPSGPQAPPQLARFPEQDLGALQDRLDQRQDTRPGGDAPANAASALKALADGQSLTGESGGAIRGGGGRSMDPGEDPDLVRARRVERTMKVLQALLRLGGGIAGTVGAMRNNPGAVAAGGALGGLGGVMGAIGEGRGAAAERDRAYGAQQGRAQQQLALARESQDLNRDLAERRVADQERRTAIQGARAEDYAGYMGAQRDATAERMRREASMADVQRAEREAEIAKMQEDIAGAAQSRTLDGEMRNAGSQISENYRARVRALMEKDPRLAGMVPEEVLGRSSAYELSELLKQMDANLSRQVGERTGGSGRSGSVAGATYQDMVPAAFKDFARDNYGTTDPDQIASLWRTFPDRAKNQFVSGTRAADYVEGEERSRRIQAVVDDSGWSWPLDDPPDEKVEAKVREGREGLVGANRAIERMRQSMEAAGAFDVAVDMLPDFLSASTQITSDYNTFRDAFMNNMRKVQGMGTPSESEAKKLEAQVPALRTLVTGGQSRLRSLASFAQGEFDSNMQALGFRRGQAQGSQGGAGNANGGRRYRVTRGGVTRELSARELAQAQAIARERGEELGVEEIRP